MVNLGLKAFVIFFVINFALGLDVAQSQVVEELTSPVAVTRDADLISLGSGDFSAPDGIVGYATDFYSDDKSGLVVPSLYYDPSASFTVTDYNSNLRNEFMQTERNFTIEAWVYPQTLSKFGHIVGLYAINKMADETIIGMQDSGNVFTGSIGGINTIYSSGISEGQWIHIALRHEANSGSPRFQLVVNGTHVSPYQTATSAAIDSFFTMGGLAIFDETVLDYAFAFDPIKNFEGALDEVRYSAKRRTDAWLNAQYRNVGLDQFITYHEEEVYPG